MNPIKEIFNIQSTVKIWQIHLHFKFLGILTLIISPVLETKIVIFTRGIIQPPWLSMGRISWLLEAIIVLNMKRWVKPILISPPISQTHTWENVSRLNSVAADCPRTPPQSVFMPPLSFVDPQKRALVKVAFYALTRANRGVPVHIRSSTT